MIKCAAKVRDAISRVLDIALLLSLRLGGSSGVQLTNYLAFSFTYSSLVEQSNKMPEIGSKNNSVHTPKATVFLRLPL